MNYKNRRMYNTEIHMCNVSSDNLLPCTLLAANILLKINWIYEFSMT
jgi:hypothetical protein